MNFGDDPHVWVGKITDGWVDETQLIKAPPINDTIAPYIEVQRFTPEDVSGTITFTADVLDPVLANETPSGVAGVRFIVDGQFIGAEDTTAPYSISWDSTTLANGSHIVTAISRDLAENTRRAPPVVIKNNNSATAGITYYIASGVDANGSPTSVVGNDANDGLSPTQIAPGQGPWQTLTNINSHMQTGATFRFRRRDAFTGFIRLGNARNITFSSYYNPNGSDDPSQPRPKITHTGGEKVFSNSCVGTCVPPNNWNLLIENLHLFNLTRLRVVGDRY